MEIRQYLLLSQNNSELIAAETFLLAEVTKIDVRDSKQSWFIFFFFPQKNGKYMRFVSASVK